MLLRNCRNKVRVLGLLWLLLLLLGFVSDDISHCVYNVLSCPLTGQVVARFVVDVVFCRIDGEGSDWRLFGGEGVSQGGGFKFGDEGVSWSGCPNI